LKIDIILKRLRIRSLSSLTKITNQAKTAKMGSTTIRNNPFIASPEIIAPSDSTNNTIPTMITGLSVYGVAGDNILCAIAKRATASIVALANQAMATPTIP
jgi:hypothetical protein